MQAPGPVGATEGLSHAPAGEGNRNDLPVGEVERGNVGESAQAQADGERDDTKDDPAHEGAMTQMEEVRPGKQDTSIMSAVRARPEADPEC